MEENLETAGEDHLKYKMSFTLRHLSAVRVLIALWSNDRIRTPLKNGMTCQPSKSQKSLLQANIERIVNLNTRQLHATKRDIKFLLYLSRRMGCELFRWIWITEKYFIETRRDLFNFRVYQYVTLDHLDVVWTCMGQVNYKKSAMRLLRFENLDVNIRFHLACAFCLKEDIRQLWNANPPVTFSDDITDVMVNFWISDLTENFHEFEELVESINGEQHLNLNVKELVFYWALKQDNETGARYMWDNHRKEFKNRQPFPNAIREAGYLYNVNFMFHLLTQADQAEQEDSFEFSYKQILNGLLFYWWKDIYMWDDYYLPTLRRVMKFMAPYDFYVTLKHVAKIIAVPDESYKSNHKVIFKKLWQYCPKDHMFALFHGVPICNEILCSLFRRRNKDLVQLILSDATVYERKEMLFSPEGIIACKNLLVNKEWDLLDMFIERALESEEDLKKFTLELKYSEGVDISQYLNEDELNWTEKFLLNSSFMNTEEMVKLKLELALEDRNEVVTELIRNSFEDGALDFTQVDDFLLWCLLSDTDVRRFKLEMISDEAPQWNKNMCEIVCKFLEKHDLEWADVLLKWCISHDADLRGEIDVFKNKCMLEIFRNDTKMEEIIVRAFEFERVKQLLTWFHPTNEILTECKELYSARECPKILLLSLLDDFIEGNEY